MASPTILTNTTFSGKNIASAASVYSFTVLGLPSTTALLYIQPRVSGVVGNGDYVAYLTISGVGTGNDPILPKTTLAAAAGETAFWFTTIPILVFGGDVVNVMVDGLAGDINVGGTIRVCSDNTMPSGTVIVSAIENNVITSDVLATSAITEIQSGLALNSTVAKEATLVTMSGMMAQESTLATILADMAREATLITISGLMAKDATALSNITWTDLRASLIDNLDVLVSSRLPTSGYMAPPTEASIATSVWGYANRTLTSITAFLTDISSSVWSYVTRTLTPSTSPVTVVTSLSTDEITIRRGDTYTYTLNDLPTISGYTTIDFSVKKQKSETDSSSIIWIRKNATGLSDGLLKLNSADTVSSYGSILINSDTSITIILSADATYQLIPKENLYYDVQIIKPNSIVTVADGICKVSADVTRTIV